MGKDNSKRSTKNHKKEDGTFHSKHINHNPQAESARAVFGLKADNSKDKESQIPNNIEIFRKRKELSYE